MGSSDQLGISVATDETGAALSVGAGLESGNAEGVAGTGQTNIGASSAGVVYVY